MPTPIWQGGTLYQPGALVRPRTTPPVVASGLTNAGFETGDLTGWTVSNAAITVLAMGGSSYEGLYAVRHPDGLLGTYFLDNDNIVPVLPGQTITASCRYRRETNVNGRQSMAIEILWFTAGMVLIPTGHYFEQAGGGTNTWYNPAVTAVAPANAAFAQLRVRSFQTGTGGSHHQYFDAFTWDYAYATAPVGLIFKAVQAVAGFSDSVEPVWPITVGATVVDNDVTWEGVLTSRVVWEATPILVSGATEPDWPLLVGGTVLNGTIAWKAVSRRIEDERCPNTAVVAIAAKKIFAADGDIISYSATVNPLDWSTPNDAGYLPFGLQTYGSNPVAAMGLYRSNLMAFNASGFQMWQVDEDPASMALLDAIPVGCTYHKSIQPVSNDLAFLTSLGVRNVGIAGASTNLQAGDFGKAIDPLVQAAIAAAITAGDTPRGLYHPAQGQYWLFFGAQAFVLTMNGGPKDMSWSRYVLPAAIDDWTVLDNDLYLRAGEIVWRVSEDALLDDFSSGGAGDPDSISTMTPVIGNFVDEDLIFDGVAVVAGVAVFDPPARLIFTINVLDAAGGGTVGTFHITGTLGGVPVTEDVDFTNDNTAGQTCESISAFDEVSLINFTMDSCPDAHLLAGDLAAEGIEFEGRVWWPYLEMGRMGGSRLMKGFDLVGTGEVAVSIGYDQGNFALATPEYVIDSETLTGGIIPMPVAGPSFQMRLRYSPNQAWEWSSAVVYLQDMRETA